MYGRKTQLGIGGTLKRSVIANVISKDTRWGTLAVVGLLLVPTLAVAKTVDSGRSSGDYAIAQASGSVDNPRKIKVFVTTSPRQKADGAWTVVCSNGSGAGSKSGNISGRGKFSRKLKLPMKRPDNCTVAANAQLSEGGRVRVTIKSY